MNPINTQQTTQYFVTTGMPPLAPVSSTSVGPSNTSSISFATPQTSQATSVTTFCGMNPSTVASNIMDGNYVTTNYVPVLLTNQTLISSVDPMQHQTQYQHHYQQQPQKIATTLMSGSNAPVVSVAPNSQTSLMQTVSKPMVISSSNTGNITYQVLTTPQTNQNMAPVITTPNGTVGVLLTSSPQTMATAGKFRTFFKPILKIS